MIKPNINWSLLWVPQRFWERALGWHVKPKKYIGVYLRNCSAIHTFGLNVELDLIWLDDNGNIIGVDTQVQNGRIKWKVGAKGVIELETNIEVHGCVLKTKD